MTKRVSTGEAEHQRRLSDGELLFREGDAGMEAYIVESGALEVFSESSDRALASLGAGALLGEMAILDGSPRSASVRACSECVLTVVTREQIIERLADADPILRLLLTVVVKRLRNVISMNAGQSVMSGSAPGKPASVASVPADDAAADVRCDDPGDEPGDDLGDVFAARQASDEAVDKMRLESELRSALKLPGQANGELVVLYQPIVHLPEGNWAGFEALVRWHHPERGMVRPDEFISVAEETGLILPLGRFVLQSALADLARFNALRAADNPPLFVAVNVSGRQFDDERFMTQLAAVETSISSLVKLEITETLVVDYLRARDWVAAVKALGFSVSMDDFGTGYSGFQQLLELDFDTVKIDQTFVRNMLENSRSQNLIAGIVSLARTLGLSVVAEGVEEPEWARALSDLGAHFGQGWCFDRPLPADEVLAKLETDFA